MNAIPSFAKIIESKGEITRQKALAGVNILADCVSATLGPGGRQVIIARPNDKPFMTKDGVTVAREVYLKDEIEDAAAQMVKEVAQKTVDAAGDGTTTATVLARAMFSKGIDAITAGANPVFLKYGMDAALERACENLSKVATAITPDSLAHIATISTNGDKELGELVSTAIKKVGSDGAVSIGRSGGRQNKLEVVDGCQFENGFLSPHFVTNAERGICELENPYILLFGKKMSGIRDFLPLIEQVHKAGRSLLVVAETVEGEALATLVQNRTNKSISLQVCAVKAPGYDIIRRYMLDDLAALTGATSITDDIGIKVSQLTLNQLGQATRVMVTENSTLIEGGKGNPQVLDARVRELRASVEREQDQGTKEHLQLRLAKLSGGVAVIRVGAQTELEEEEKRYRVEDALHATRCAMELGVVPGGGVALVRASVGLTSDHTQPDFNKGMQIVAESMLEPLRKIVSNAGYNADEVCQKVQEGTGSFGFNALTGEYGDLMAQGVIDPLKVTLTALKSAESIASLMLTSEAAIVHPIG